MSYTFRKAIREQTSVLLALAGSSGSGKTYSALRLARGLAGDRGRVALIDTEAGRALHYAERFDFDHCDLKPPFAPSAYADAIAAAEGAGYPVIVVDSLSHEWAGDGGCQDLHDAAHERLGGTDQTNVLAWREPKLAHKRMVSRLLQCRAHLIVCLRAEPKIKFTREFDEKKGRDVTKIADAGWQPICEKNWMYEMTASFMLHDERPGVGLPIKLQEQHKVCFPAGHLLDEAAGQRLAAWASGGVSPTPHGGNQAPEAREQPRDEERLGLIAEIKRLARSVPAGDKAQAAQTYLGGVALDQADIEQVSNLLTWLKARTGRDT